MSGMLSRLVASRRRSVAAARQEVSLETLKAQAAGRPEVLGFSAALAAPPRGPLNVIAELKAASPSEGPIRVPLEPGRLAGDLARAGAAALSVLTEVEAFGGAAENLELARQGSGGAVPLLRKDFIVDPWQVWESRVLGADALLLIVAALEDRELETLLATTSAAGLEALVEVHDHEELSRAIRSGARMVGVNARNLSDFSVSLERVEALGAALPGDVLGVAESGITAGADLARLAGAGYRAALVGTALMRAPEPGALLAQWLAEAP